MILLIFSDIIALQRKEGSRLIAFAVREHFAENLTWGVVLTVAQRLCLLFKFLFLRVEKKVCL